MASSSSAVKVVIRTRPTASFAQDYIKVGESPQQLSVKIPKSDNPNAQDSWSWKFDAVLHNASQETVYLEQVQPIVQQVLRGFNGTIMCYGQTGAGKTFTQTGSIDSYQNRGLTPRAIAEVFHYFNDMPQYDATVSVSYLEIHNDSLIDLLSTLPTESPTTEPLSVFEDKKGQTEVKNQRVVQVTSEEEALALLFEGTTNRTISNHMLNRNSTRGHAIFTLHIRMKSRVDSSGVVTKCKLHLVDLAGSERLKKTDTLGALRDESMYINKSLTYLEQVVVALASKGRSHTPYRQSKLTHLLKDSLGGNCKTMLIANIYGEQSHLEETISTLQFAARVRLVPNDATINQDYDAEQLLKRYAMEISDLKRELAMHDSLASRTHRVTYEPYSDTQREELMASLQNYLDSSGEGSEMSLESVRQMRELLTAMKTIYSKQQGELERTRQLMATGGLGSAGEFGSTAGGLAGVDGGDYGADGLGELDPSGKRGIPIGHAGDTDRPAAGLIEPPTTVGGGTPEDGADGEGAAMTQSAVGELPGLSRSEAYVHYKTSEGSQLNERLMKAKKGCKEAKLRRTQHAGQVNEAKKSIDVLKTKLDAKRSERTMEGGPDEAEIIDEEEYRLIQEMKEAKGVYKGAHAQMTKATTDAEKHSTEEEAARKELVANFNEWYAASFNEVAEENQPLAPEPPPDKAPSDVMDEDEQFEQLEMARILSTAPDSLPYVRARKAVPARSLKNF